MEDTPMNVPSAHESQPAENIYQPVSGTYSGLRGSQRIEIRLDLRELSPHGLHQPLNLVSGDLYRNVGGGSWDYTNSFIVEHPQLNWSDKEITIEGTMESYRGGDVVTSPYNFASRQHLHLTIPLHTIHEPSATATADITYWGCYKTTFLCDKTSAFLRTIDLEIDRITGTKLPGTFRTQEVATRPPDLPPLDLDVSSAYRRAGIDLRVISDNEVFDPKDAGTDLKWDEDELHNAMEHHFSQWQDAPQWKLYLLIATHFRLYPSNLVTGIMYDTPSHDPSDPFPRQGAAVFYSSMISPKVWGQLPKSEFERNYLRTCVHELGHALNLLHSFDGGRPDSPSWMNYPWRYPYGYDLPQGWKGTQEYWRNCRFEFDAEELRHLRHHSLLDVIPGGAAFGSSGQDLVMNAAASPHGLASAPVALYVRTRPERYLFHFAEPVTIELKLQNQTKSPMIVPDMLNPEFGLVEIHMRGPKGQVQTYSPLFKLCGEGKTQELPPGEKLFESIFIAYGAGGFYFQEPGEYQIWAIYTAGGLRLRSNALRIRVAYPQSTDDEEMALYSFGEEQGHILYMKGAEHLQNGTDELREVADRYPNSHLARYIHYCFGNSQTHEFKDVVSGKIRQVQLHKAVQQLTKASTLLRDTQTAALDNITYGRTVDLLYDCYRQLDAVEEAETVLNKAVHYFKRMRVKKAVIDDYQQRIDMLKKQ